MKKIFILFLLPTFMLFGQTINFDDPGKWTAGSGSLDTYQNDHKYVDQINGYDVEFTGEAARRKASGTEDGYPTTHNNSAYAWELNDGGTQNFVATVHATQISGFSFYVRQKDNNPNPIYYVEKLTTDPNQSWIVFARLTKDNFFGDNSDWKQYVYNGNITESESIGEISIRIRSGGFTGPVDGLMIDDFSFDNPLPVELTTFTATFTNNKILLEWETATEINNYGFDIQTSNNKIDWNTIDFVKGNGTSNSPKHYSYSTEFKAKYFRLKQIDVDGSFEFSGIVEVAIDKPQQFEVTQNYPNPFNPETTISFILPEKENVQVVIYNSLGEVVKTLVNETLNAGIHKYNFDASALSSGIYYYKVTAGTNSQIRKMMLMK